LSSPVAVAGKSAVKSTATSICDPDPIGRYSYGQGAMAHFGHPGQGKP
jgi:hypothetical protein